MWDQPSISLIPLTLSSQSLLLVRMIHSLCSYLAYSAQKAKDLEKNVFSQGKRPLIPELNPSYLPPDINICFQFFPFIPPGIVASNVQPLIEEFLPPIRRAVELCDFFLEHLSFSLQIVSRRYLVEDLIPVIYKEKPKPYGPHELSLLFVVLGIGCLLDPNLPPYNLESQHYYRLARASLALQSILATQSVITVKVVARFPSYRHVCHVFDASMSRFFI